MIITVRQLQPKYVRENDNGWYWYVYTYNPFRDEATYVEFDKDGNLLEERKGFDAADCAGYLECITDLVCEIEVTD